MVCRFEHAFEIGVLRKDTRIKSFCNCNCRNNFVVWCGHMSCVFWWQWCCQNMPTVSYASFTMLYMMCFTSIIVRQGIQCISRLDSNPWNRLDSAGHRCAACFDVLLCFSFVVFVCVFVFVCVYKFKLA